MIDATPSATPMPAPPVATVTNLEAPSPPANPPPVFVPPTVTDPVSNLDFPPVDDAFALEMRSETIEQLAGGDALRRGVSERIEAGRSQANADLVAGRDRVRVQATLHEHTGHGLAEQAAHLHTTVDGRLDVHAASEDTVLLAGHMRDRWDGGAAIVAAMSDDTVGGGGIRVTTPLDLWVHGLMGVEERIGTCTADAVLMELGATHYEREYGPGAHAAGLAVYTGSLYQSNRSTFRALMRVSSGVRNLIAGGGGTGEGGGSAPAASPLPVPAQTGAATESATGTLAAARRAAQAPATALDAADAPTGARRVPLGELLDSVDARGAEEMREAGIVMRAEHLPEFTRSADTAERLGALQETPHIDGAASGSDAAGGFRASEADGAVSMHPATGGGGAPEIEPPSAVHGENAPIARLHPGVAWGQGPEMKLGLLGGADRPPRSAPPESDFHAVYRRLRELEKHYDQCSRPDISLEFKAAVGRVSRSAVRQFANFGGNTEELAQHPRGITRADQAVLALQELALHAEMEGSLVRADAIRLALDAINERAVETLQALCTKHDIAEAPPTLAMPRPPATAGPTVTVADIPPPGHTSIQSDWILTYRQLRNLSHQFWNIGWDRARLDFDAAVHRMSQAVNYRFRRLDGNPRCLPPFSRRATNAEQRYRAIEDMVRQAAESGAAERADDPRKALEAIHGILSEALNDLTTRYGALEALSTRATLATRSMQTIRTMQTMQTMLTAQAVQLPPASVGPTTSATPPVTVASTTVPPPGRLELTVPAHTIVLATNPAFPEPAGGLVHATDVPGPPPASGLPGPSLAETVGARAGDLGRSRLGPPATVSGATSAQPASTGNTVTPALAGTSSFWLQPVDPVRGAGLRSLRLRPAAHRRDRATPSRHHHREQHRPRSRSRRCVPHPFESGRRRRRPARPPRRPAPPEVQCVADSSTLPGGSPSPDSPTSSPRAGSPY